MLANPYTLRACSKFLAFAIDPQPLQNARFQYPNYGSSLRLIEKTHHDRRTFPASDIRISGYVTDAQNPKPALNRKLQIWDCLILTPNLLQIMAPLSLEAKTKPRTLTPKPEIPEDYAQRPFSPCGHKSPQETATEPRRRLRRPKDGCRVIGSLAVFRVLI